MLRPVYSFRPYFTSAVRCTNVISDASLARNTGSDNKQRQHTTVDSKEVGRHTDIANDWWAPGGAMKALHSMNQIRVPFIRDGILQEKSEPVTATPLIGKKLLDVGCGGGILSEPLARLGAEVTGIDASKELIQLAIAHSSADPKLKSNPPTFISTTMEDHVQTHEGYYDAVVASEVIEHVSDPELFVKSCVGALKPGGNIFFTTPNRTRVGYVASILIAENVLRLLPRGMHDWNKFITPPELSFLLERYNCRVQAIYGCMYSFVNNRWYFIKSQSIMYALHAVKNPA